MSEPPLPNSPPPNCQSRMTATPINSHCAILPRSMKSFGTSMCRETYSFSLRFAVCRWCSKRIDAQPRVMGCSKLAGLFDRAIIRKAKPLLEWVNNSGADFHDHFRDQESLRPSSNPPLYGQSVNSAAEAVDRSLLDETDGTYTDASPKASFREALHDRKYTPLHTVNMTVRNDRLDQAPPESASTASTGKYESVRGGVWPA